MLNSGAYSPELEGRVKAVTNCARKPFCCGVLKPKHSDRLLHERPSVLHTQAMWKLNWFLRDFGYVAEVLERTRSMTRS
jgi:hypothetical protein